MISLSDEIHFLFEKIEQRFKLLSLPPHTEDFVVLVLTNDFGQVRGQRAAKSFILRASWERVIIGASINARATSLIECPSFFHRFTGPNEPNVDFSLVTGCPK
jgi:hypothetical protein